MSLLLENKSKNSKKRFKSLEKYLTRFKLNELELKYLFYKTLKNLKRTESSASPRHSEIYSGGEVHLQPTNIFTAIN